MNVHTNDLAVHWSGYAGQSSGELKEDVVDYMSAHRAQVLLQKFQRAGLSVWIAHKINCEGVARCWGGREISIQRWYRSVSVYVHPLSLTLTIIQVAGLWWYLWDCPALPCMSAWAGHRWSTPGSSPHPLDSVHAHFLARSRHYRLHILVHLSRCWSEIKKVMV